jgi:hypothetical protein
MTNTELTDILLKHGAHLYSFIMLGNNINLDDFIKIAVKNKYSSFSIYVDKSLNNFIEYLNDAKGIIYIYNNEYEEINYHSGVIRIYEDISLNSMRLKKLGKINYEIFKKRIINTI